MEAKYLLVAHDLEKMIPQMILDGETKFPGEEDLCRRYACSRQTVRAALKVLQEKELIMKYKGSGTYISTNAGKRKVAFVLPSANEYIFPSMVRTAKQYCMGLGMELVCLPTENRILKEREVLSDLLQDSPAGILLYPSGFAQPCMNTDLLQQLTELGVPVVSLRTIRPAPDSLVTVTPDIRDGSCELAHLLVQNGKRKLKAILPVSSASSAEQYIGLMQAEMKYGIGFSESDVLWLSDDDTEDIQSSRYDRLTYYVQRNAGVRTAVFCGNDEIAYHMLRLFQRMEVEVPNHVMVAGFDNSYYCTMNALSITSAGTENDAAMKTACRTLLQMITGRRAESTDIPMTIFSRRSTEAEGR